MKIYFYILSLSAFFLLLGCNRSIKVTFNESAQLYVKSLSPVIDAEDGIHILYHEDKVNSDNHYKTFLPKDAYLRILKQLEKAYIQKFDKDKHKRMGFIVAQGDKVYFIDLEDDKQGVKLFKGVLYEVDTSFKPTQKFIKTITIAEIKAYISELDYRKHQKIKPL